MMRLKFLKLMVGLAVIFIADILITILFGYLLIKSLDQ